MKILRVIASIAPRYGGPSNTVVHLCGEMVKLSQEVTIFTTNIDDEQTLDVSLDRPVR